MKICADCKFCVPSRIRGGEYAYAICSHPKAAKFDLISGNVDRSFCKTQREDFYGDNTCGKDGRNFEPKYVAELIVIDEVKDDDVSEIEADRGFLSKLHAWWRA